MRSTLLNKFREVLRLFDRELFFQNLSSCCGGVTLTQCHTLLEIENTEKITISELAKNLILDKSTVSRTVDNLVVAGFIDRTIPAENRRTTSLSLTTSGKKTTKAIKWNNENYLSSALSIMTEHEQKDIVRLLDKLTENMIHLRQKEDNMNSKC